MKPDKWIERETRLTTMVECAKLVCPYCDGNFATERDRRLRKHVDAGRTRFAHDNSLHESPCSPIWRSMAADYGLDEVQARSPREWRET